tara:strand:- start:407 stop:619 length:213 start_codon:yes stop_codon:yes gene_type:complete
MVVEIWDDELEEQRRIDDDYNVVNHYYAAKRRHPDIPFYLQDENGETFEFKWDLIYQYIKNISQYNYPDW